MAQPSVASFYNTRKRPAAEEVAGIKNRHLSETAEPSTTQKDNITAATPAAQSVNSFTQQDDDIASLKAALHTTTRSGRVVKRIGVQEETGPEVPPKVSKVEQLKQGTLVQFIKKGPLSPRKKPPTARSQELQKANEATPSTRTTANAFASKQSATNVERGLKTPTKQIIKGAAPLKHGEIKTLVRKELNFDEVKSKLSRSDKLQELKASLARIQNLEKTRKVQEERNRRLREGVPISPAKKASAAAVVQLKEFDSIELEVLTSPVKTFKTPTKLPPRTPDKNELMSPRHTLVSKRILFSPTKHGSPSKLIVPPAYQRFASLVETSKAGQLPLPHKYRTLVDIFKGLDSVCAMFHNRKECITMKKLKPAVQRMLRKNFHESHLAQIRHLYPDAFMFTQMKMRNYGSVSKADYFQLVVTPNVETESDHQKLSKLDGDNVLASAQSNAMNPHVMTERLQRFQNILLQRVMDEHEKFLKSLDPPLSIAREKVTRWHPDFDLENCSDIESGHLPQPPNVEKYSSARDILSTARNLFNCATPMERVLERYESKVESDRITTENLKNITKSESEAKIDTTKTLIKENAHMSEASEATSNETTRTSTVNTAPLQDATAKLLKGLPQSLLDKIRAKQAAKALDAMTRRPSQDQEATKYSRLPDLARHLRNVFITERKSVLTLEIVIKKIQNSFRTCLSAREIEAHLQLLAKEVPTWVAFHEVRKTMYLKIARDMDLAKIVERLEAVANEKSK